MRNRICAVVLMLGLFGATANAADLKDLGVEIVGASVGVAVGLVIIIYLVVPKQKKIEGCVVSSDHGLRLTNDNNHETYVLTGESAGLQPGMRVKVKGKRHKKHAGEREFEVRKTLKQEGACTAPSTPPAS